MWFELECRSFRFKLSDGLTIAVQSADDEEQKKEATAAGQRAQYDWSTRQGRCGFHCKACAHLPPVSTHSIINVKTIRTHYTLIVIWSIYLDVYRCYKRMPGQLCKDFVWWWWWWSRVLSLPLQLFFLKGEERCDRKWYWKASIKCHHYTKFRKLNSPPTSRVTFPNLSSTPL